MRGRFITLEGIDGAGKSTHVRWISRFLQQRGVRVKMTREPGGTAAGEKLRRMVLEKHQRLHPETETLLMFAARREHLDKLILPALKKGTWVLCDRFTDATFAYQSGGSGVPWDKVGTLEKWVHQGLQPDLTILFDLSPELGRQRAGRKRRPDRFEREREAYYQRVHEAYRRRAQAGAPRVQVLDAADSRAEVRKELEKILTRFCK
jgi:dTMP kinase